MPAADVLHIYRPIDAGQIRGLPHIAPAMVRLFASVLKREGDRFFLVTPVEKLGITVEDAPFLAIDADIGADAITFTTNTGDVVTAGPDNAIRVDGRESGLTPGFDRVLVDAPCTGLGALRRRPARPSTRTCTRR